MTYYKRLLCKKITLRLLKAWASSETGTITLGGNSTFDLCNSGDCWIGFAIVSQVHYNELSQTQSFLSLKEEAEPQRIDLQSYSSSQIRRHMKPSAGLNAITPSSLTCRLNTGLYGDASVLTTAVPESDRRSSEAQKMFGSLFLLLLQRRLSCVARARRHSRSFWHLIRLSTVFQERKRFERFVTLTEWK